MVKSILLSTLLVSILNIICVKTCDIFVHFRRAKCMKNKTFRIGSLYHHDLIGLSRVKFAKEYFHKLQKHFDSHAELNFTYDLWDDCTVANVKHGWPYASKITLPRIATIKVFAAKEYMAYVIGHEIGHTLIKPRLKEGLREIFLSKIERLPKIIRLKIHEYWADFYAVYFMKRDFDGYMFGKSTIVMMMLALFESQDCGIIGIRSTHPEGICRILFTFISEIICLFISKDK